MLIRGTIRRDLPERKAVFTALQRAAMTTSVLFLVIIAGLMLSRLFVYSGFVDEIVDAIKGLEISPFAILIVILLMYLLLGCFMDTISMTVVTVPFVYPIITSLGLDPIWFGVILIKLIEIGVLTPPVGLNLFAVISSADGEVSSGQMFRGILPFLMVEAVVLTVLVAFPGITLWLPSLMNT
jgi:C4-dicarboxylate transporter, DctM subunit